MLRLEILSRTPEEAILKVEGWIAEEGVLLLEQQGRQMRQEAKHLVLDLQGVRSIDRAGVALLKCWTQDGVALRRPSPFVQALLETHGLA